MIAEHVEQKLPNDCERVVTIRKLDHLNISIVNRLAEIRERILISSFPFDFAGELEQQRLLPDHVERDVSKRDVLFENRPVPAPLRKTVAQHQAVVSESEE